MIKPSYRTDGEHVGAAGLGLDVGGGVAFDYLFDLEPDEYDALWRAVRRVETVVRKVSGAKRIVIAVVGYEIAHAHVHLIPTNELQDFPLPLRKTSTPSPDQFKGLAARMRAALEA